MEDEYHMKVKGLVAERVYQGKFLKASTSRSICFRCCKKRIVYTLIIFLFMLVVMHKELMESFIRLKLIWMWRKQA